MAEETLKLPKPLLGNEIRNDFLTFPPERRWDLLGFIKSDDVEEIKSCEIGPVSMIVNNVLISTHMPIN